MCPSITHFIEKAMKFFILGILLPVGVSSHESRGDLLSSLGFSLLTRCHVVCVVLCMVVLGIQQPMGALLI